MTFKTFMKGLPIALCFGLLLGCVEFAVMQYANIHLSWIIISGVLGIDLSVCEVFLIREKLPGPEQKLMHFIGRAVMFSGVILIGFLGMILY